MSRESIARAIALGCVFVPACVKPAPLGSLDTGETGDATEGDTDAPATEDPSMSGTSADTGTTNDTDQSVPDDGPAPVGPAEVDILFVLDNSGSMGEEQAALAGTIDTLVTALEVVQGVSYRIGVTTTDNGNPWCGSTSPEAGKLVASTCRSRTNQFVFNGNPPADATDIACTDICSLDSLSLTPTPVEGEEGARVRPWIENIGGVTNLGGTDVGDALRCMLPQGIAGCGFESPLEAAYKAVLRSQTPGEEQFGFIRDSAHLVLIFVTDETDCSYVSEQQWIFLPEADGGDPSRFWSDPDASAPTSAVCWNAGVICEPSMDAEVYESCRAANNSASGADVPDDEAVLHPVSRYVDFFADLLAQKRATSDASVFLYGVLGVPNGYPANPLVIGAGDAQQHHDFGVGPGCESETTHGVPPIRQLAVIESFDYANLPGTQVFSICDPNLGGAYDQIVAQITPYLGG